ncbi:ATP synthase subunit gamma, mitochondrial-like [Amphiura filiformis]|uniref:ATP synthase subunit gamma, mitochondrial-like n=1 Tax=Amphiura filiformis TaxID=82378 RepID=UPI003B225A89
MATLKLIQTRLKSVKNIQKITKSMKMIAAARYAKAEKDLRPARSYGAGATALYDRAEIESDLSKPNHLIIAVSSDRGLCGGIHSTVTKAIKASLNEEKAKERNNKVVVIGDKVRDSWLGKTHPKNILFHIKEVGRKPPNFTEASLISSAIMNEGFEFDTAEIFYNKFKSVVSYQLTSQPVLPFDALSGSDKITVYDDVDADILRNYTEFQLASILYYCIMESACSEQSARMTAMDAASKNAGEMIDKLTLQFNRTRQAVITRELIEIISGAAAL